MKSQIISMFLALSAVTTLGSTLYGQSYQLKGDVPFSFQVGGKHYDAGKYTVSHNGSSSIPVLSNDTKLSSAFIAGAYPVSQGDRGSRLVFRCYSGSKCFLAEIWPGTQNGLKLSTSKAEKEVIRTAGAREVATLFVDLHRAD